MHAAALTSPRLQRVLKALSDGKPHSSLDIVRRARVLAVSACVSELRQHGAVILCHRQFVNDIRVFFYTMTKAPKA